MRKSKRQFLDNRFSTVEHLAKQIYNFNRSDVDFDVIEPNSPTKRIEKTLFEQIINKVMPRKTVMCVDVYDIQHQQALASQRQQARATCAVSPLALDCKQRAISPRITMMGFSKDAFFNKKQGILKPCLNVKKVNVFADFGTTAPTIANSKHSKRSKAGVCRAAEAAVKRNTMMAPSKQVSRLQSPRRTKFRLNDVSESSKQSKRLR